MIKTINILLLISIYSCGNNSPHKYKKTEKRNFSVSMSNNNYDIDTNIILENKNLTFLITELEHQNFINKNRIDEIPHVFKTFLDDIEGDFLIANPNENFESGCCRFISFDKNGDTIKIPNKQLSYFGLGEGYAIMTYFQGGSVGSKKVLIFKYQENKILDFWCDNILYNLKTTEELIRYLKKIKKSTDRLQTERIEI
ncbi:MAG: hypothetical protein HYR91_12260 [Flavobacteriia bacterium]|nr:hypothetical protein [Flavobacteriia bacterium]